jgi:hypothetical protein
MFREYYFNFKGFNFVSSVDVMSEMYQTIKKLPESIFIEMNLNCLSELLANTPMNTESISKELEKINAGGSQAFISLAGNN